MTAEDFVQQNHFLQSSVGTVERSGFELLALETVFVQTPGRGQPVQSDQIARHRKSRMGATLQNRILFANAMTKFLQNNDIEHYCKYNLIYRNKPAVELLFATHTSQKSGGNVPVDSSASIPSAIGIPTFCKGPRYCVQLMPWSADSVSAVFQEVEQESEIIFFFLFLIFFF